MQKDVWRRCKGKKLGGFLVRNDRSLVGLLEGAEKLVIAQVENLIRKKDVQSVYVLHESMVDERSWKDWHTQFERLTDIPQADALNLAGLAQNVMDAVEADQINT
jgi:hypothetical protein